MKKWILFFVMMSASATFGFQSDMIFPWVTNNGTFQGKLILNNLSNQEAEVILVATRNDGSSDAAIRTIGPLGQLVESAAEMFPVLGTGPGYTVIATSGVSGISGAFVISATGSASGSSPAQADVASVAGSRVLLFNFLPVSASGASAPVVVNLGPSDAEIIFHAFQDGDIVATSEPVTLPPGRPFAQVTGALFPGISGDLYVVADSNEPLVGTAFIFNAAREPSMANAIGIDSLPGPVQ